MPRDRPKEVSDLNAETDEIFGIPPEKNVKRITNETVLVRRAKNGDAEAFGVLYDSIKRELFNFAMYTVGSREDAEDVVQESLIRAWTGIRNLNEDEKFRIWMFRILRNECKRFFKNRSEDPDTVRFCEEVGHSGPTGTNESASAAGDIISTVRSLPPPDGQMVLMSIIGGFNSTELAQVFSMTPSTVRSRLSRAVKMLRKILSEVNADEIRKQ